MNKYYYFPIPPSLNKIYKPVGNSFVKTTVAKKYQNDVSIIAKAYYKMVKITGAVKVAYILVLPDNRTRDTDNYLKLIKDGLKNVAFEDDTKVYNDNIVKIITKEVKSGIYVNIESYIENKEALIVVCKSSIKF